MDQHRNFAVSTIAGVPSPATSGVSLSVAPGDGVNFPPVPFQAIICPAGSQPTLATAEIVRVTAMTGDAITTMVRAQEGTSPRVVTAGDMIHAGPTKRWWDDVETTLTTLAPRASPTFTGVAVAPNIAGGAGPTDSLTLRASNAIGPTGTIDMIGNAAVTFRHRASDGHVIIGGDAFNPVAANVTTLIRSGTASANDTVTTGTGFAVIAGDDNAPAGAGTGALVSWNVQNSSSALQSVALGVLAHGQNTAFTGNLVGLQVQSTDEVGQASGAVFGLNITCNIGRAVGGSVDPAVTSHTAIQGAEIDVNDRAGVYGENNGGYAVRLGGAGPWDWTSAMLLSASVITQGTFHNAILIPSTAKTNSTGVGKTVTNWASGVAYTSGTSYVSASDGTKYVCAVSHTSTTGGAHPNPINGGNTTDWTFVRPSALLYAWNSSVRFNMAEVVTNNAGATRWIAKVNSTNVAPAAGATWAAWANTAGPNQNVLWYGPLGGVGNQNPIGIPIAQITAGGDMQLAGNIGFNGQSPQALTGWATPTGTRDRTTWDPSTVTHAVLATKVCALVIDLLANGVIG